MAYTDFHQPRERFERQPPIFHDTDGSPVYEGPYNILLRDIVACNDVSALYRYNESPHTRIFLKQYETHYYNPFTTAFQSRSFDTLRALIEIYLSDPSLTMPLEEYASQFFVSFILDACYAADEDLVLWLINHDPPLGSLTYREPGGRTPLYSAAEALGELDRATGILPPLGTDLAVSVAREKVLEHRDRIEKFMYWLMDNGCNLSESTIMLGDRQNESFKISQEASQIKSTVLGVAIPFASYKMTSYLISKGANVHSRELYLRQTSIGHAGEVTPLHIAATFWNIEGMQALIDNRGNVKFIDMVSTTDDQGRLPLHWAMAGIRGSWGMGEVEDTDYMAPRMLATIKTLLQVNPATVNSRDQMGGTVFHYAPFVHTNYRNHLKVVQVLLDAQPSPDTINFHRDEGGLTAVGLMTGSYVPWFGTLEEMISVVMVLLENGADPRQCNKEGLNVLHILCFRVYTEPITPTVLDQLLNFVDVNEADHHGRTALHYLAKGVYGIGLTGTADQTDALRYLINRGADVTQVDYQGNTPLHDVLNSRRRNEMGSRRGRGRGGSTRGDNWDRDRVRQESFIQALVDAGASLEQPNEE